MDQKINTAKRMMLVAVLAEVVFTLLSLIFVSLQKENTQGLHNHLIEDGWFWVNSFLWILWYGFILLMDMIIFWQINKSRILAAASTINGANILLIIAVIIKSIFGPGNMITNDWESHYHYIWPFIIIVALFIVLPKFFAAAQLSTIGALQKKQSQQPTQSLPKDPSKSI